MEYSKHRFEFFSDGVMAIIMTIMVLEIPVSKIVSFDNVIELLKSILIFFVSFFIVGWFWNKHHLLIDNAKKITNKLVWRNLLFLFVVALLPLFTKVIIENPNNFAAVISYDVVFLSVNICFLMLSKETYKQMDSKKKEKIKEIQKKRMGGRFAYIRFVLHLIILLGIIILSILYPQFSIVLYVAFPVCSALLNVFIEKNQIFMRREGKTVEKPAV